MRGWPVDGTLLHLYAHCDLQKANKNCTSGRKSCSVSVMLQLVSAINHAHQHSAVLDNIRSRALIASFPGLS